jgi:hypothetical protein
MSELPPVYTEKPAPGTGFEPAPASVHVPITAPQTITLRAPGVFKDTDQQWVHCCSHVRTAAKIIGWVHVVLAVVSLVFTIGTAIFMTVYEDQYEEYAERHRHRSHHKQSYSDYDMNMMYCMMIAASVMEAVLLVVYSVMLRGAYTGRKALLIPYLVIGVLLGLFTYGLCFAAVQLYVTYVILRCYRYLAAKERAEMTPPQHTAYVYMPPPRVQILNNSTNAMAPPAYEQQATEPEKIAL